AEAHSQEFHICIKNNFGYTNAFYFPNYLPYNYNGKFGLQSGFAFYYQAPNLIFGFETSYREINYDIDNGFIQIKKYISIPIVIGKKWENFHINTGFINNFSLLYNKIPKEITLQGLNPEPFLTLSLFIEPKLIITDKINLSIIAFSDISPSSKTYANNNFLFSVDFSYGFMFSLEYNIFTYKFKSNG
ncbi:MAG: hypothetical protein U9Q83_00830, partial [Bacteroidota bacterium]|nr:hypothetical protein [Bacteroidota bacterium]